MKERSEIRFLGVKFLIFFNDLILSSYESDIGRISVAESEVMEVIASSIKKENDGLYGLINNISQNSESTELGCILSYTADYEIISSTYEFNYDPDGHDNQVTNPIVSNSSKGSWLSADQSDLPSVIAINKEGDLLDGVLQLSYEVKSAFDYRRMSFGTLHITSSNVGLCDINDFAYLYQIDLKYGNVTQLLR